VALPYEAAAREHPCYCSDSALWRQQQDTLRWHGAALRCVMFWSQHSWQLASLAGPRVLTRMLWQQTKSWGNAGPTGWQQRGSC
jgi:hypothetical protein